MPAVLRFKQLTYGMARMPYVTYYRQFINNNLHVENTFAFHINLHAKSKNKRVNANHKMKRIGMPAQISIFPTCAGRKKRDT